MTERDYYRFRFKSARGPSVRGPIELSDLRGMIAGLGIPYCLAVMVLSNAPLKGSSTPAAVLSITLVVLLYFATLCADDLPRLTSAVLLLASSGVGLLALVSCAVLLSEGGASPELLIAALTALYAALVAFAALRLLRAARRARRGNGAT